MLALIREAEGLQSALNGLRDDVKAAIDGFKAGTVSQDAALGLCELALFREWPATPSLSIEAYHFTRSARRNERERERNANRRLQEKLAGAPGTTSPDTLLRTLSPGTKEDPLDGSP